MQCFDFVFLGNKKIERANGTHHPIWGNRAGSLSEVTKAGIYGA